MRTSILDPLMEFAHRRQVQETDFANRWLAMQLTHRHGPGASILGQGFDLEMLISKLPSNPDEWYYHDQALLRYLHE